MRLLKDKRGQVRVIEAFFASVLLLSSLTIIPVVQQGTGDNSATLSTMAFNILSSLDSDGHLAELVDSGNWGSLRSCIQACVPAAAWFNLTVLDENMNCLNTEPICSGGAASSNINAADYVCVSPSADFAVYVLRLQLAGLD